MPKEEDYITGNEQATNAPTAVVDKLRQSFKPPGAGLPVTPAEKLEEALAQVQNSVREEQMASEQELQNCLGKAASHVANSQSIDTLFALCQQIASIVSGGDDTLRQNAGQLDSLIRQLEYGIASQQAKADKQVQMALCQAVSALSDAHNAMFQSQTLSEITQLVRNAAQVLRDTMQSQQSQQQQSAKH